MGGIKVAFRCHCSILKTVTSSSRVITKVVSLSWGVTLVLWLNYDMNH